MELNQTPITRDWTHMRDYHSVNGELARAAVANAIEYDDDETDAVSVTYEYPSDWRWWLGWTVFGLTAAFSIGWFGMLLFVKYVEYRGF